MRLDPDYFALASDLNTTDNAVLGHRQDETHIAVFWKRRIRFQQHPADAYVIAYRMYSGKSARRKRH